MPHDALRVVDGRVVDSISLAPHSSYALGLGGDDGHTLFIATTVPLAQAGMVEPGQATMRQVTVEVGAWR